MEQPQAAELDYLLANLGPELAEPEYIFAQTQAEALTLNTFAVIREQEGITQVLEKTEADKHRLAYSGVFKRITLTVNSSLEAVGLTAAVSSALSQAGISANVIAAFHHDYIFVPADSATQAMVVLYRLSQSQNL